MFTMAEIKQNLFSVVLVGRHNPMILNHDFLIQNDVLPKSEPFYQDDLKNGKNPFKEFIATPPLSRIVYGEYSLHVQEDRYQASDQTGDPPSRSPIIDITKKYFGEILKYTPLVVGGINLNYDLVFGDQEEQKIDEAIGLDHNGLKKAFDSENVVAEKK